MADCSTVMFVPSMRFSSWPSISGSHWSKFLFNPAKAEAVSLVCRSSRGRAADLTEVALQEGQRGSVAEVDGELRVNLPFELHQLPDPVSGQEGEVGEALVDRSSGERRRG